MSKEEMKDEYIEYFKNNVMPQQENNGPYDGWFNISNWEEMVSLRNEVEDETSLMAKSLKEQGVYEKSLEQLKIITIEEYIKSKQR
tara:strand:- start:201 stop:458 length:258 start_codon:yes stop_codon:yes gene_type:complete